MREAIAPHGIGATILGVLGLLLYAGVGFLYLTSGLVVPMPWLAILWLIWLAGLYPLIRLFSTARAWTVVVPVVALAFWWAYLSLGEALFGWTA